MATSTIKMPAKINGVILQGDQVSDDLYIGYREVISQSLATKSVPSSTTVTLWGKITLSQGVWLINLVLGTSVSTGSTGNIGIRLATSTGSVWYDMSEIGGPGTTGWTAFNIFRIANLSESVDVYPAAYQQTGSARNMYGYFHAMKI